MLRRSVSLAGLAVLLAVTPACVLIDDFDKFAEGTPDAGPGGLDASADAEVDAFVPDEDAGPDCGPEICNGEDDDCDGSTDEEPTECSFPNAVVGCVDGACAQVGCEAGFEDCTDAPGCETDIRQPANCGSCGNACTAFGATCVGGSCGSPVITDHLQISAEAGGFVRDRRLLFDGDVLTTAVDTNTAVILPDRRVDNSGSAAAVIRLNWRTKTTEWVRLATASRLAGVADLAVDGLGDIHALGRFGGEITLGANSYDSGSTATHAFLWTLTASGGTDESETFAAATSVVPERLLRSDGRTLFFGRAQGDFVIPDNSLGANDAFIVSVRSGIAARPTRMYGGTGEDSFSDAATISDGGFVVSGCYTPPANIDGVALPGGSADGSHFVLAMFNDFDDLAWSRTADSTDEGCGPVAVDEGDNTYWIMSANGPVDMGGGDTTPIDTLYALVGSHTRDGAFRWQRQFRNFQPSSSVPANGHLYIAGNILFTGDIAEEGSVPFAGGSSDVLVIALRAEDGSVAWLRSWGGNGNDQVDAIAVDGEGDVWIGAGFTDRVPIDGAAPLDPTGLRDAVLLRIDAP